MLNTYQHSFLVECPNNDVKVLYHLTIETRDKILVEQIIEKCNVGIGYHEDIADALLDWFGGRQIMTAFHHGVWIITRRGDV